MYRIGLFASLFILQIESCLLSSTGWTFLVLSCLFPWFHIDDCNQKTFEKDALVKKFKVYWSISICWCSNEWVVAIQNCILSTPSHRTSKALWQWAFIHRKNPQLFKNLPSQSMWITIYFFLRSSNSRKDQMFVESSHPWKSVNSIF